MINISDPQTWIKRQLAYIDTIELFFRYCPNGLRSYVEDSHGRRVRIEACRTGDYLWGYRLIVHQPQKHTLLLLNKLKKEYNAKLCRFDLAIDFISETEAEANQIKNWLLSHVILKWRRKGQMHEQGDGVTINWIKQKGRKRRSNRDLALYADKPSKITGQPCAHLELKFHRTEACRQAGIKSVMELITIDPQNLFSRYTAVSMAGVRWSLKIVRRVVKEDQARYRNKRTNEFVDKYRAALARKVKCLLRKTGQDRAQVIKDQHPKMVVKTEGINALNLPSRLTWRLEDTAVENID